MHVEWSAWVHFPRRQTLSVLVFLGIVLNGTPPPRHRTNLLVDHRLSGSGHDAHASTSYPAWGRNGLCPNAGNISPFHECRRIDSLVEVTPRHWPERELVVSNKGAVLYSVYHQLVSCEDRSSAASLTGQLYSLTHSQPLLVPEAHNTPTPCYPTLRQPLSSTQLLLATTTMGSAHANGTQGVNGLNGHANGLNGANRANGVHGNPTNGLNGQTNGVNGAGKVNGANGNVPDVEGKAFSAANAGLDYDVLIVGAGLSGIFSLHRMRQLGLRTRVLEAGSGEGGTWFW